MSTLSPVDRVYLERLFEMENGYVLDLTNDSFQSYIKEVIGVDIYAPKYRTSGGSKAKLLRSFWALESDALVGKLLEHMLQYEAAMSSDHSNTKGELRKQCSEIASRLLGRTIATGPQVRKSVDLLSEDFSSIRLDDLPLEGSVIEVLKHRLSEAQACFDAKAYLAVVILCGSILEALLLGTAQKFPKEFNTASSTPMEVGKPKGFFAWKLAEFIEVATQLGRLSPDVKQFGHALREFRNYVHPYQQMSSGFTPDEHTAKISLQVLLAAIADLSGKRGKV